jgi:tRNA-splicing ligase RtcB
MQFCLEFATANRRLMMERLSEIFLRVTGYPVQRTVTIHHNFVNREKHFGRDLIIHRKGATQAFKGQEGIIPGSMGANSYITVGLGNEESFQSCSHGAGRRMGRKAAQRSLDLAEEQRKMKGIVYDLNTRNKLDEAPDAYKDIHRVMEDQQDLAKPVVRLQPLGVIKG